LEDQSSNVSSTDDQLAPVISEVETANNNGSKQLQVSHCVDVILLEINVEINVSCVDLNIDLQ
jgi:hypothetical protein